MPELPEVETVMRGLQARLQGRVIRARGGPPRRPALGVPARPGRAADRRPRHGFRRRAKYILMRLDGGDSVLIHLGMSGRMVMPPRAAPTTASRACTSTSSWKPTTAGASASSTRAGSAPSTWCRPPARTRTACWPGWARSRWTPASTPPRCPPPWPGGARRSRRPCWTSARGRPGQHLRLRGAVPRRHRPRRLAATVPGARAGRLVPRSRRRCRTPSRPAGRACATTCSPMASSAISSTPGRCTAAKGSPATLPRPARLPRRPAHRAVRPQHVLLPARSGSTNARADRTPRALMTRQLALRDDPGRDARPPSA